MKLLKKIILKNLKCLKNMKISLEQYDHKASYETNAEDLNVYEVLEAFKGLMITLTWQESTIIDGMKNLVKEYEESNNLSE